MIANGFFCRVSRSGESWVLEDEADSGFGTGIRMTINPFTNVTLKDVFDRFSGEDYQFNRTHFPVELAKFGDENLISRSQAKRVVSRFERFDEVFLDFKGVESIGQAFADEIFRVFANQHPDTQIHPINTSPQVKNMISRARKAD